MRTMEKLTLPVVIFMIISNSLILYTESYALFKLLELKIQDILIVLGLVLMFLHAGERHISNIFLLVKSRLEKRHD